MFSYITEHLKNCFDSIFFFSNKAGQTWTALGLNIVVLKKSDLRLWFKKRLAEVLCVTQSGLRPVVSQWDEQSATMCKQYSPVQS